MSYLDRVPTYVYELPCGHDFRSRTESHPDGEDGLHWFYCERCSKYVPVAPTRLAGGRPKYASGSKRMGDHQLSVLIDSAITRDRIAAYYETVWDRATIDEVATTLGVARLQVVHVALDLGIYESQPRDLGDAYR